MRRPRNPHSFIVHTYYDNDDPAPGTATRERQPAEAQRQNIHGPKQRQRRREAQLNRAGFPMTRGSGCGAFGDLLYCW